MSSREWIYQDALERIARGEVAVSYECDATPTEKEIAVRALAAGAQTTAELSLREQLIEFHTFVGQPVLTTPQIPDEKRVRLRAALIAEEFFETIQAMFNVKEEGPRYSNVHFNQAKKSMMWLLGHASVAVNMAELADGLADLNYVIEGTHLEFGIDGKPIAAEVHRSNMEKKAGPVSPTGKILKPPGWKPPDIEGALKKQGWNS